MSLFSKENTRFERVLQEVCAVHGLRRDEFVSSHEDIAMGRIILHFKPAKYSDGIVRMANKIHDVLNEEFRGEVVRAAVPEFSKSAGELADAILNPQTRVVNIDLEKLYD